MTTKYVTLNDFEWLGWPFYVICSLLRTATDSLFVTYLLSSVYYALLKFGWNRGGVALFRKPARVSETGQDRTKVITDDQ